MTATGNKHKAEAVFYHQEAAGLFCLRAEMLASETDNISGLELGDQYLDENDFIVCTISANAEKTSREEFWNFVCKVSTPTTFVRIRWIS